MIHRLISGAGAVSHWFDRVVARLFSNSALGRALDHRPGSLGVAAGLAVLAVVLAATGLEATANPIPRAMAADEAYRAADLGGRTYAAISGYLSNSYVETYEDTNDNGRQDSDELGQEWFYFVGDGQSGEGIVVRSKVRPDSMRRTTISGTLVSDSAYVAQDLALWGDSLGATTVEPVFVVDGTVAVDDGQPLAPAFASLPPEGTAVVVSGTLADVYVYICPPSRSDCAEVEAIAYDYVLYDPVSGRGIVVVSPNTPATVLPVTLTGMLRDEPATVREALDAEGLVVGEIGVTLSDRYFLHDGTKPASAPAAFVGAGLAVALGLVLFVGWGGDYVVFRRRRPESVGSGAAPLEAGDMIAVRVTGTLRSESGLVHVREAPAAVYRLVPPAPSAETDEGPGAPGGPGRLVVERVGVTQGVDLGRGELTRVLPGVAMLFRGPRPALRLRAGTGRLTLTFESATERDRARAALIADAGLVVDGEGIGRAS